MPMRTFSRSSTGCSLCRKRKIKCDEGKPGCLRCAQIRHTCPGYPLRVQLDFHVNNDWPLPFQRLQHDNLGEIVAHASQIPIANPLPDAKHRDNDVKVIKTESTAQNANELYLITAQEPRPPPRYDINHQSLCFFLDLFCFQAAKTYSFPVIDFLPDILQDSSSVSSVQHAAIAVSRMALADRYSGRDARLSTANEYGKALTVTNAAIRASNENASDDTVVAVWLLGLYEHINAVLNHGRANGQDLDPESELRSHISHIRGALHLLQSRGKAQFKTPRSEKIFRVFKAAIQMRLFALNSVTSKDFSDLELDIYRDDHEFIPSKSAQLATSYFLQVARLCETIKGFLQRSISKDNVKGTALEANSLIESGESLDSDVADWSKIEPGWEMMKIRNKISGSMWSLYPSHALYYFYSPWIFLYWIRLLIARIKLYEALIQLKKLQLNKDHRSSTIPVTMDTTFQLRSYQTIIQMTAAELIGLTAYALGDVTSAGKLRPSSNSGHHAREINVVAAMQLVIPLKVLQRSEYLTATQKGAINLAISHIGDGFRRQPTDISFSNSFDD